MTWRHRFWPFIYLISKNPSHNLSLTPFNRTGIIGFLLAKRPCLDLETHEIMWLWETFIKDGHWPDFFLLICDKFHIYYTYISLWRYGWKFLAFSLPMICTIQNIFKRRKTLNSVNQNQQIKHQKWPLAV